MPNEKIGTLAAIICGISYGAGPIFAKIAYQSGVNTVTVLAYRFLITVLLLSFFLLKKGQHKPAGAVIIRLMLLGGVVYAGNSGCYMLSYTSIPASLASMLLYLFPTIVTISTVLLKQEVYTWEKGVALAVTTVGLFLLLNASFASVKLLGILFGIASAVLYSTYVILGTALMKSVEPFTATLYINSGAAISYSIIGLSSGQLMFSIPSIAWVMIVCMAFFATILAVLAFWVGVKFIGPAKTSIFCTIEPLFTAFLSFLFFQDILTMSQLTGGFLIIAAVFFLHYTTLLQQKRSDSGFV
ncbi:MAG: DMT family transporter [Bacillota bacterium]